MAQLPATRSTRNTLLQDPPAGPRSPERHSQPTRIRHKAPGRTGQVGTVPGPGSHRHLRKMRTTNHKQRHMGPRPHPGPHHMDRARTRTLQPKRRTSQQHTNARTLDTTTLTNSAGTRDDDKTKGQTERRPARQRPQTMEAPRWQPDTTGQTGTSTSKLNALTRQTRHRRQPTITRQRAASQQHGPQRRQQTKHNSKHKQSNKPGSTHVPSPRSSHPSLGGGYPLPRGG